jgi:hypothetical protein
MCRMTNSDVESSSTLGLTCYFAIFGTKVESWGSVLRRGGLSDTRTHNTYTTHDSQDDIRFDIATPTPVCAGFSVSFEIRASDANANELVTLDIYDNTGAHVV